MPWELRLAFWGAAALLLLLAALYSASAGFRGGFDAYCDTTLYYVDKVPVLRWLIGVPIATKCLIVKSGSH